MKFPERGQSCHYDSVANPDRSMNLNPAVEEEKKNRNHRWTQMNTDSAEKSHSPGR
jgi:hypothetical protein